MDVIATLNRSLKRVLCLLSIILMQDVRFVLAAEPSSPANGTLSSLDVVRSLFNQMTKPVPGKMRLAAKVETTSPTGTEEQVLEAVRRQEESQKAVEMNYDKQSKEKLREFRINSVRAFYSGHKTEHLQEWFLGRELWRGDSTDTSLTKEYDPTKGGTYFQSIVNFPSTNQTHSLTINPAASSATFNEFTKSKYACYDLWQAYVIEPNAGLFFVSQLVDRLLSKQPENVLNTSFEGLRFDSSKASQLLSGKDKAIQIKVDRSTLNAANLIVVTMSVRQETTGDAMVLKYFLDADKPDRITRIEIQSNSAKMQYLSERSQFDKDGFPWLWTFQNAIDGKVVIQKRFEYTLVDLAGSSVNESVFSPQFPTNYVVVRIDSAGNPNYVQNPHGSKGFALSSSVLRASHPAQTKKSIVVFCLLALTILPLFIIFRNFRRTHGNGH